MKVTHRNEYQESQMTLHNRISLAMIKSQSGSAVGKASPHESEKNWTELILAEVLRLWKT